VRKLLTGVSVLFLAALAGLWWVKFEHEAPAASIAGLGDVVGRHVSFDVVVSAPGFPGLRRVGVRLLSQGKEHLVAARDFPPVSWIGSGVRTARIHVDADLVEAGVREGEALLRVAVDTFAWHVIPARPRLAASHRLRVDTDPPSIRLVTTQHNIRVGGAAAAVFRVSKDAVRTGVAVADYFFPATRGYYADPELAVALFAVPQDLPAEVRPQIEASDAVGNRRAVELPCHIRPRRFASKTLTVSDGFIESKVRTIIADNHLDAPSEPLAAFLFVNGPYRRATEKRIRSLTRRSAARPLWKGAFHRQSKAATMSSFADRRAYRYRGKIVDRQTHLGYDLASVRRDEVEASQNGVVVFGGRLGIYGNTVILDHGLGVFSLYAHLDSIAVRPGQKVRARETLGRTGATGLAGGDHLHFSIMLYGVHVDPVEWWDGKWLSDHISAKLEMFPAAAKPAASSTAREAG